MGHRAALFLLSSALVLACIRTSQKLNGRSRNLNPKCCLLAPSLNLNLHFGADSDEPLSAWHAHLCSFPPFLFLSKLFSIFRPFSDHWPVPTQLSSMSSSRSAPSHHLFEHSISITLFKCWHRLLCMSQWPSEMPNWYCHSFFWRVHESIQLDRLLCMLPVFLGVFLWALPGWASREVTDVIIFSGKFQEDVG